MNDSIFILSDTLNVHISDTLAKNGGDLNNIMPWIVALLIGGLSIIANILINKGQRRLTMLSLQNQSDLALKSINKDILSKNRQEWINTLRDCISNYLSSHELSKLIAQHKKSAKTPPEYGQEFKIWQSLGYKIQLLLNPNEEKSKQMIELMTKLNLATDYRSYSKEEDYERIKNEIIKIGQSILKEEWERVKKLE